MTTTLDDPETVPTGRPPLFSRIAVVNRGEPAVRLIKAVRELNAERGTDIKVVALHTESERGALFVRAADEGVLLRDVGTAGIPYLDHAELERALQASGADAVWVGWGFVAEDAAFAELCARLDITFIGPSPEAMRRLGDKVEAKLMAEASNVPGRPVVGRSGGDLRRRQEARRGDRLPDDPEGAQRRRRPGHPDRARPVGARRGDRADPG